MNEVWKESFESLNQEFCYSFVNGVAKANGLELVDSFGSSCFWDEAYER